MLLFALLLTARADPERPLARVDEPVREQTWYALDGPPYRPKWRNRRGRFTCLTWPDGIARRCIERAEAGTEIVHRFDVTGAVRSRVRTQERPVSVTLHNAIEVEVDLAGWTSTTLGAVAAWLPEGATTPQADTIAWTDGDRTITLAVRAVVAPSLFDDTFAEIVRDRCGCLLLDRSLEDIDGRPAIHYRAVLPHPGGERTGEIWAVALADRVVLLTSSARAVDDPAATDRALAPGRAVAATLIIQDEP